MNPAFLQGKIAIIVRQNHRKNDKKKEIMELYWQKRRKRSKNVESLAQLDGKGTVM